MVVGGLRFIIFADLGYPSGHKSNGVVAGDGALVKMMNC